MKFSRVHRNRLLKAGLTLIGVFIGFHLSAQQYNVDWLPFEGALQLAQQQEKPVLVDVWAPWCGWCKKMQKDVYPELTKQLEQKFILTRLNRDDNESKERYQDLTLTPLRLAQKLNVQSVPAIIFLSPEGEYLFHISGFMEAEELGSVLNQALSISANSTKELGPNK